VGGSASALRLLGLDILLIEKERIERVGEKVPEQTMYYCSNRARPKTQSTY